MNNFQPLEVVDRCSETQIQVVENLNNIIFSDSNTKHGMKKNCESVSKTIH